MLMMEIKKIKTFDHVRGENETWKFLNLESSYERYLAHSLVDAFINDYEGRCLCYELACMIVQRLYMETFGSDMLFDIR